MPEKTVSFRTFGCKQNQYDTDFLRESFERKGFRVVDDGPSDVVVINTCAVTAKGAAKCRQAIRAAARNGAKVVVTGCYSQVAPQDVADIPGVIAVGGVRGRSDLADLALQALESGKTALGVTPHEAPGTKAQAFEETPVETPSLTRAFLKIQEGCGDFCAYCIVPLARGPSRSRPPQRILGEARALVAKGYKEIVLTGTHIGLYGKEEPDTLPTLPEVVRQVSQVEGLVRLRISSLEPHDVDEDLLDCLRLPQVCAHLHLPLQSGSDRVLRAMGRRYNVQGFLRVVEEARKIAPNAGITTDIIAGFPGESRSDFEETLNVARAASFSRIHAFKFSPRPGTRAFSSQGKVPESEKDERVGRLIELGKELSLSFHRKHEGRVMEVLTEDDRTRAGLLTGVTRNYVRCEFGGGDEHKGKLVAVRVNRAEDSHVTGELISGLR